MKIREANEDDIKGIARVHVDSWRTTYKGIVPDTFLEKLSYEQREQLWEKNIKQQNHLTLVAENEHGEIVGFADGGKRPENQTERTADLTAIYLLKDYQRQGIGQAIQQRLFLHFKEQGYDSAFVEVLDDNASKYFYESSGASFVREEDIQIGGKPLKLLVYKWSF
ncbi:GNAT family N-acetyltransferase [Jeotgalibacillus sp. R-1-5s-1]|uniref:GNAT family N-acetyltransferase n=1 Tax=Jeotgalibacillus sp. R-1-5s-1 TaxID=2555897 RepID=UPI00106B1B8A|nr:GNAT family N-acetyltransferase [Jeotgalibacillus sp. R-1-5s-1]TFD99899.1 GNAT family N-acetyltransferase [Jeotgalibacillus sp. R-1-5s-1]